MYSLDQLKEFSNSLWFVYSLSYKGQVFYIGVTTDMVKRYKMHLTSIKQKAQNKTTLFIKMIIDNNDLPEMNIVDSGKIPHVFELEGNLIKWLSRMNQPLTNRQFKRDVLYNPKNIPNRITKKDMLNIIKYKQGVYIHQHTQPHKVYTEFPNEPFL